MSNLSLFPDNQEDNMLPLEGAEIRLYRSFLSPDESEAMLGELIDHTPWQQDVITIAGKKILIPRLQAWYGDEHSHYAYSGLSMTPLPWTPLLSSLRSRLQEFSGAPFNSVLVNYYRDGSDSVSWHADDETELGPDPVIASLSLGATRTFRVRRRNNHRQRYDCSLENGSLLVMGAGTQVLYEHQIPKETSVSLSRINLTFRQVHKLHSTKG